MVKPLLAWNPESGFCWTTTPSVLPLLDVNLNPSLMAVFDATVQVIPIKLGTVVTRVTFCVGTPFTLLNTI
jgi:hypothetical protein